MSTFAKVHILGRLGRDPDIKTVNDSPICKFSVACDQHGGAGKEKKTLWLDVNVFGKAAPSCADMLRKGSLVFVEGRLEKREWLGKDGSQKTSMEIFATDVKFVKDFGRQKDDHAMEAAADADQSEAPF